MYKTLAKVTEVSAQVYRFQTKQKLLNNIREKDLVNIVFRPLTG